MRPDPFLQTLREFLEMYECNDFLTNFSFLDFLVSLGGMVTL